MPRRGSRPRMIKINCYNHFGAHLISATLPTMCEDYRGPYLCQLYPQTCLATGICLAPIGPRMHEYGLLLYCDGGKKYDKKKRPGDCRKTSQISKINPVTIQKEDHFLKMKKSISAPESLGYYPAICVRNYPQRVPYRWGHCIRPYGLSPRRGWGEPFCLYTLYF